MKSSWASILRTSRAVSSLVLFVVVALLLPPQMQDMLAPQGWAPHWAFQFALLFFALAAWHWSRTVLLARFGTRDRSDAREQVQPKTGKDEYDLEQLARAFKFVPRILFLSAAGAGIVAALKSGANADAIVIALWSALFLWLLARRHQFQDRLFGNEDLTLAGRREKSKEDVEGRRPPRFVPGWLTGLWHTLDQLVWYAPFGATVAVILLVVPLAAFIFSLIESLVLSQVWPEWSGTAAFVAYWWPGPATVLVCLGFSFALFTVLTYWADRLRLEREFLGVEWKIRRPPVMIVLLGLIFWLPELENIHAVRIVDKPLPQRWTLERIFEAWTERCVPKNAPARPIIVAISGGASRAALWGARVLRAVDDAQTDDGAAIFAISSVSGGSLGAAVYLSLRSGQDRANAHAPCRLLPSTRADEAINRGLDADAIAPLLAGSFYSDVPRAFLAAPLAAYNLGARIFGYQPAALRGGDRDAIHERGFEQNWRAAVADGLPAEFGTPTDLSGDFLSLFYDVNHQYRPAMPIWIADGADAQNGERILTQPSLQTYNWLFVGAEDALAVLKADVPISTAVSNTARFPFLSPSGELTPRGGTERGKHAMQIVDGGYFENEGLQTALELAHWLETVGTHHSGGRAVLPIIVQVTANGDAPQERDVVRCPDDPDDPRWQQDPRRPLGQSRGLQALVPLLGLYNVRGGHAAVQLRLAQRAYCPANAPRAFFHFYLYRSEGGEVPMNWVLSKAAGDYIWNRAMTCRGNPGEDANLRTALGAPKLDAPPPPTSVDRCWDPKAR